MVSGCKIALTNGLRIELVNGRKVALVGNVREKLPRHRAGLKIQPSAIGAERKVALGY